MVALFFIVPPVSAKKACAPIPYVFTVVPLNVISPLFPAYAAIELSEFFREVPTCISGRTSSDELDPVTTKPKLP